MKRISITALIALAIWIMLTVMGYQIMQGVIAQHASGYSNAGQIQFYIIFPAVVASAVALSGVCFWYERLRIATRTVQALSFFALFPYLLFYTGGM